MNLKRSAGSRGHAGAELSSAQADQRPSVRFDAQVRVSSSPRGLTGWRRWPAVMTLPTSSTTRPLQAPWNKGRPNDPLEPTSPGESAQRKR
jgi:hypothetical protein